MNLHAFVDESRRGSMYLLATALLRPADLGPIRCLMRGLRVPGERKLHFKSERDAVKKDIAAAVVSAKVPMHIYIGLGQPDAVRERELRALVTDLVTAGLQRLVLDSRGPSRDHLDRRVIRSTLAGTDIDEDTLTYEHLRSHEEPALWVPDAIAWCYGAGGEWRRRVQPVVEAVADLGSVGRYRKARH